MALTEYGEKVIDGIGKVSTVAWNNVAEVNTTPRNGIGAINPVPSGSIDEWGYSQARPSELLTRLTGEGELITAG